MKLYLSHESALQFYRSRQPDRVAAGKRHFIPDSHIPSLKLAEAVWLQEKFGITMPVSAEVAKENNRRRSSVLTCPIQSPGLAQQGYFHLGKNLYVAPPELALAQVAGALVDARIAPNCEWKSETTAKRFAVIALAVLGSELAASYVLNDESEDGLEERAPALNLKDLDALLENSGPFHGKKALKQARHLMVCNAKSPAEIELALFASLPMAFGGAGLPKPVLNKKVSVAYGSNTLTRDPDLLFEGSNVVLEYNGSRHEGERADADDERRNELIDKGFEILVVNKGQLQDANLLEHIFSTAAKKTGKNGRCSADYAKRREDVRAITFGLLGTACKESANIRI